MRVRQAASIHFYAYLRIDNSTISGNYTRGSGGGLRQFGGTALIANSVIVQNYARRSCGGLNVLGFTGSSRDTTTIVNSTIAGNTATGQATNISFTTFGGGVCNRRSPLTLINTTVSGNVALRQFFASGGGIFNGDEAPLTLINTTVSSNRSEGDGGGIGNEGSPITLIHSTITGNVSASTSTSADDGRGALQLIRHRHAASHAHRR